MVNDELDNMEVTAKISGLLGEPYHYVLETMEEIKRNIEQAVYNLQDERTKELITRELTNMETKAMNIYNNEVIFKDVMESADAVLTALKGTEAENAARDFKEHLAFEFFTANTAGEPIGNIEKVIEEVASFTNLLNKIRGGMYFLGIIFSSAYKKQEMLTK